jgi:pimeloyl-ACP methyl ester carboxylesterase
MAGLSWMAETLTSDCRAILLGCLAVFCAAVPLSPSSDAQTQAWRFAISGKVAELRTPYASVMYYVPVHPRKVVLLASGYPWPDGTVSDAELKEYVRSVIQRWVPFADQNGVLLVAPAFGNDGFAGFRGMCGSAIAPDVFVDELIDGPASLAIPNLHGRFSIVGHSAGAQFAARYLVAHPDRLDVAILSAPSTYPFPNSKVAWPFGEAAGSGCEASGAPTSQDASGHAAANQFAPPVSQWLLVSTSVPTYVMVGTRDLEQRPSAPGQMGATRLARAHAWVDAMRTLANSVGKQPTVQFVSVPNAAHDEEKIVDPASQLLKRVWKM